MIKSTNHLNPMMVWNCSPCIIRNVSEGGKKVVLVLDFWLDLCKRVVQYQIENQCGSNCT
jgi:hypothetical protein